MYSKTTFPFLMVLFFQMGFSQEEKPIKGRIIISDASPNGVIILNLVNEKETTSDRNGEFIILAKPDDVLVFHASNLDNQRKIIDEEIYESGNFSIGMTSKIQVLDEVEIRNDINALSLGILSQPAKSYTPAERRLRTAGDFKPIHLLGLLGGSLELDPILNAINGRTARLKREIGVERRELLLKKINDYYNDVVFIEKLNIPKENIGEFKQYLIEDVAFEQALEARNEQQAFFIMSKLSANFLNLKNDGK